MSLSFEGLLVRNFGSYVGEHTIHFRRQPGLFYVRGDNQVDPALESNGCGKSTLFNALAWCLYGKTLRDERPGDSVEPWTGESPTIVSIVVRRDNDFYRITRQRQPNKLLLDTNRGGEIECDQKRVDEVIGLPFELFRCTIMLPQFGEMFLDLKPEEQAALFSDALDLDLWLKSADMAGALLRDARQMIAEVSAGISRDEGRLIEIDAQIVIETAASECFDKDTTEALVRVSKTLRERELEYIELNKKPKPSEDKKSPKLAGEIKALWDEEAALFKERTSLTHEIASLTQENDRLSASLRSYKTGSKCPECGQAVPASHIAAKRKPLSERIAEIEALLVKHQSSLESCDSKMIVSKNKREALLTQMEQAQRAHVLANAAAIKTANRLEAVDVEIGNLRLERKKLTKAVNPHEVRIGELQKRRMDTNSAISGARSGLQDHEWNAAVYENWQTWFRQIRLDVIDGCLSEIESIATKEAQSLGLSGWQMKIVTERETAQGNISRKMSVMLYPPGREKPVRLESYCGGEDQRWQLAVRFALSEILLGVAGIEPSIEILDEPSVHVSPKGVEDLMVFLRERAHRLGREIWVVEQHVLDESLFDGVLEVYKDVEGSHARWSDQPAYPVLRDDPALAREAAL